MCTDFNYIREQYMLAGYQAAGSVMAVELRAISVLCFPNCL